MSAYSLVVCVVNLPAFAARAKACAQLLGGSRLAARIRETRLGRCFFGSVEHRARSALFRGVAVDALYAAFRLIMGAYYGSVWFVSLAAYHLVLGAIRAHLAVCMGRAQRLGAPARREYEYRLYRRTGALLMLLDIPMGGMILLMIVTDSGFEYAGFVIYLSAMYAFYAAIKSAVGAARSRRHGSPALSAARVTDLAAAMMSVLGLQTAMITRFDENGAGSAGGTGFRILMNTLTGSFVWFIVLALAAYMLARYYVKRRTFRLERRRGGAMNKSESKYFATAAKMDEALLALLEKKDLEYITVKDICAQAGVNRSTFYLHYETIGDLLLESVNHINEQFVQYMNKDAADVAGGISSRPPEELIFVTPEYLVPYLSYVSENRRIFATAVKNAAALRLDDSYKGLAKHILLPIMERFSIPQQNREYMLAFYVHGLMAIVSQWLKNGCAEPVEQIAAIMEQCVMGRDNGQSPRI